MNKVLSNFLEKVFDIRAGEYRRAVLMQIYIFLIIFTLLIVKPTASSLFLSKFGVESLPYAFILVALLAAGISSIYARLLNRLELNRLIKITLRFCIGTLFLFGVMLRLEIFTELVLYLFYLWVMLFAVLTTSQFWILANMVFNSREAKRLFGFIGAGAIMGGIFGGYAASILAQVTASENLLFLAVLCLLPCFYIVDKIWTKRLAYLKNINQPKSSVSKSKKHPLKIILASKHLSYLAGIVGLSVVVAKLVDYQFSAIAAAHYPDKDELTAFFGFWFSTFNVISLGLQLFLTKRIMENVGVSSALYFLPVLILVAAALLLFLPEVILAAVFLKLADGSLKQSVNKAAMELMVLPIPNKIKNSAKTFIDVFVDSLATGFSGLLLIFVVKGLALPSYAISLMILGITIGWIFLIVKIRKEYLYAFKLKIETTTIPTDISQIKSQPVIIPNARIVKRLGKVLEIGTEQQILWTLKNIKAIRKIPLFKKTVKLFKHPSATVRAAAIRNANVYNKQEVIEEVEQLITDDSLKVQIRALEYLLKHDDENRIHNIEIYMEHDHYQLRGTALAGLANLAKKEPLLAQEFHLDARLFDWFHKITSADSLSEQQFRKVTFLKAISSGKMDNYYGHISKFLQDENAAVVRQAILSAGRTQKEVFLNILVSFLKEKSYRASAQNALQQYNEKAFPLLIEIVNNPQTDVRIIRSMPKIIRKVPTSQAVQFLYKLLDFNDLLVRQHALRGLNRLRFNQPDLDFSDKDIITRILEETRLFQEMLSVIYRHKTIASQEKKNFADRYLVRKNLIQLIEKHLDNNLERLFLLLGLKYSPEDMLTIYRSIRGSKADIRINALEFLDNILGISLKKLIIPIIETTLLENLTEKAIQQLNLDIPEEKECLEKLLLINNKKLNVAVLDLIKLSDNPELQPLLEKALKRAETAEKKEDGGLNDLIAA